MSQYEFTTDGVNNSANLSAASDALVNDNISVEGETYQVVLKKGETTINFGTSPIFPGGRWILNTDAKEKPTITRAAAKSSAESTTSDDSGANSSSDQGASSSSVDIDNVVIGIQILVEAVKDDEFLRGVGENIKIDIANGLDFYLKGLTSNPVEYDNNVKPSNITSEDVIIIMNGAPPRIDGVPQFIKNISDSNEDFGYFLVDGANNNLVNQKNKQLYANFQEMLTFLGITSETKDASIAEITSALDAKNRPKESTTGSETKTKEINFNAAKEQIVTTLETIANSKPEDSALLAIFDQTDFATRKKYSEQIKELIAKINNNRQIDLKNPTPLRDQINRYQPLNAAVYQYIKRIAPDKLEKALKASNNSDAAKLLHAGTTGTPALEGDAKVLYDNCINFADYLGFKDDFVRMSVGGAVPQGQSGESQVTASPGETPADGATESPESSTAVPGAPAGAGSPESFERAPAGSASLPPPEPPKPEDYVYFFYKLIRVDPSAQPPVLKVSFPNSTTVLEYTISQEQLGMRLSFVVDDQTREYFQKAVKNTDLTVSVTGTPFTGGGPITLKTQIPFSSTIPSSPKMLTFSFADVKGKTVSQGIKTGRTGVAIDDVKEGTVTEVYYNARGGIATTVTDATCSAKGRTYTFTFERGLMIPVKIPASLQESTQHNKVLKEAASTVPHWLFIKPRTRGAGGGAGGSGIAGGGTASGDGMVSANIAVKQIQIKTREEWIKVPNTGNPWDLGSFKFALMDASPARPGAGKVLGKKEAKSFDETELARILFVNSDAWALTGIACFGDDPSVTGYDSSITTREIGRPVSMVSG